MAPDIRGRRLLAPPPLKQNHTTQQSTAPHQRVVCSPKWLHYITLARLCHGELWIQATLWIQGTLWIQWNCGYRQLYRQPCSTNEGGTGDPERRQQSDYTTRNRSKCSKHDKKKHQKTAKHIYDEESDHSNKAVRKTPEIESGHKVSEEVK